MNFDKMYCHVEEVTIESKIVTRLPESKWMNSSGLVVEDKRDAIGCKVEVDFIKPGLVLVLDEVGCNTSQECDNNVGGKLLLTGRNNQVYRSISTYHNHFTVIGVTALNGDPVLCVVIIAGKNGKIPVVSGIDWDVVQNELNCDIKPSK